jgi:hypothetical protein
MSSKNLSRRKFKKTNLGKVCAQFCSDLKYSVKGVFVGEACRLNKHFSPAITHDKKWILRIQILDGWSKSEKQQRK